MKAKNLETGIVINCGPKFIVMQGKPYLGTGGKVFPNGVWVQYEGEPMSDEAAKVIEKAKKPLEKKPAEPVITNTIISDDISDDPVVSDDVKVPEAIE